MRKLRAALCAFLIAVMFSLSVFSHAADYSDYNLRFVKDGSRFCLAGVEGSVAVVRDMSGSKVYSYDFGEKIFAWCCSRGKLYAFICTNQPDVFAVYTAANGKTDRGVTVAGFKANLDSLKIAADKNDNLFITNSSGRVDVYDKNGKLIYTTKEDYRSLKSYSGKVYASDSSGLSLLSAGSERLLMSAEISGDFSFVSDNIICDSEGNVFDIAQAEKLFCVGAGYADKLCVTKQYFVAASGKKLAAFDKSGGNIVKRKSLGFAPVAVYCKGDAVCLVKNDMTVKSVSLSKLFPKEKEETRESSEPPQSAPKLDFGEYQLRGEYIYISNPITRTQFRDSISCDGYKISFSSNRGVGTGTKMTLTGEDAVYTYTFVTRADVTGEGNITDKDLEIVMDTILGLVKLDGARLLAADMDDDGEITTIDLHFMLRSMQGYDWEQQLRRVKND